MFFSKPPPPPWKSVCSFIWTNLNPINPLLLCAKFGWKWSFDSAEEDISMASIPIIILFPLWKGHDLSLNLNLLYPGMLCPSSVEILVNMERKMWKVYGNNDYRQHAHFDKKLTWAFCLVELKSHCIMRCSQLFLQEYIHEGTCIGIS